MIERFHPLYDVRFNRTNFHYCDPETCPHMVVLYVFIFYIRGLLYQLHSRQPFCPPSTAHARHMYSALIDIKKFWFETTVMKNCDI